MTRILAGLLAAVSLALPAVAMADVPKRVVGGTPAPAGKYPFYALLQVEFADGSDADFGPDFARCGGALIAARYVITAGHCLDQEGSPPVDIQAAIGDVDTSNGVPPEKIYEVKTFLRHPDFGEAPNGALSFDLGILELDRPAPEAQLRLPRPSDTGIFPPGTIAIGMGFGATSEGGQSSDQLLEVPLPIVADAICAGPGLYGSTYNADLMLCAGGELGKDTCQGDSGGPLVAADGNRHLLAGIVSFGPGCAKGFPAVYADSAIDPLNAFIRGNVPQVEITAVPAQPEPGQPVSLTAVANNPNGAYTSFAWDLDNDGAFDDGTGSSANRTFDRGIHTIGIRAIRDVGSPATSDNEIRRVDLDVRFRSPVGFTAPGVSVGEGGTIPVTVTRSAGLGGGGSVTLVPSPGSQILSRFGATTISFAPGQSTQTVNVGVLDDFIDEPDQQFRIDLSSHAGDLIPGSPGQIIVTVIDNDLPPSVKVGGKSTLKVKRNAVTVEVPLNGTGTLILSLRDSRGRLLSSIATRAVTSAGTLRIKLKLNSRGRRALKRANRGKGLKVKAVATYTPTGQPTPLTARRNLKLKR